MKRFLRNLFGCLTGSAPARTSVRRQRTAHLHVEHLEERAVPTIAMLSNLHFALQSPSGSQVGTLYITRETSGGLFTGYFDEVVGASTVQIPVTGQLTPIALPGYDEIWFSGSVHPGNNLSATDSVSFEGGVIAPGAATVHGGAAYLNGTLDEFFASPLHHSNTDIKVFGWGSAPVT